MSKPVHSKKCIIAFLDLLGATKLILGDDSQEQNLNKMRGIYDEVIALQKDNNPNFRKFQTVQFKIFSDNIVFVQELTTNKTDPVDIIEGLFRISGVVSDLLYYALIERGWMFRGAIACGDVYLDSDMIWGKGLVDAYNAEQNISIYPRVIITDELIHEVQTSKSEVVIFLKFEQDFDGIYYLDFLTLMLEEYEDDSPAMQAGKKNKLMKFRDTYKEILDKLPTKPDISSARVRAKHHWFINDYNRFCMNNNFDKFQLDPSLIKIAFDGDES
ncbi:hypothetical protein [Methanorbis furvi]|uniref:Uncharacterized protein n=1 Tax=Methanorbis furvi TaxID=3028299 RepID=A0AAE4SA94_9EURY|nr:hypothetical protein [Methanocorpusculaceae archaeon Ag1]